MKRRSRASGLRSPVEPACKTERILQAARRRTRAWASRLTDWATTRLRSKLMTKPSRSTPADPNGFAGRGEVFESLRMPDRALGDYNEAIRLDPAHSRAYCGRGVAYFALGRDDAALADLDKAIALDSTFSKAYSFRGAIHARQGRNEQALADYDMLIRLLPARAGAYKDRGGLLVRMRQFDRAIDDLERGHPARSQACLRLSESGCGVQWSGPVRPGDRRPEQGD